jgi:hypothetical protein
MRRFELQKAREDMKTVKILKIAEQVFNLKEKYE